MGKVCMYALYGEDLSFLSIIYVKEFGVVVHACSPSTGAGDRQMTFLVLADQTVLPTQ